jgi:uncharacterized membrane protein YphA (DoxX/SURF4 family)
MPDAPPVTIATRAITDTLPQPRVARAAPRRPSIPRSPQANLLLDAIGGVALILGLGMPVVGVLVALNMLGAWVLVHTSPG